MSERILNLISYLAMFVYAIAVGSAVATVFVPHSIIILTIIFGVAFVTFFVCVIALWPHIPRERERRRF